MLHFDAKVLHWFEEETFFSEEYLANIIVFVG